MGRENDAYRRFHVQHAVASLVQLRETGLSERTVQRWANAGRIHRIHHGVYGLVPRELLSRDGRYMAAVLACSPEAVLSHRSAAALHDLQPTGALIEVTIPRRSPRAHPGIRIHRSTTLTPQDTTTRNGIPCTTVARTLLDLAEVIRRRPLERAFDQADILEILDLTAMDDQLGRNARRRGAAKIKRLLTEHYAGATPTWSELEEAFLALTRAAKLPPPEVNAFIVLDDGEPAIRADFVWREQKVVVETDGHRTHRTRQAFETDRRRDQRLTAAGWRPIRVTWRQVMRTPAELQRVLRRVLAPG